MAPDIEVLTNEQLTELVTLITITEEEAAKAMNKVADLLAGMFKLHQLLREKQDIIIERLDALEGT